MMLLLGWVFFIGGAIKRSHQFKGSRKGWIYCRQPLTENMVIDFKMKKEEKSGEKEKVWYDWRDGKGCSKTSFPSVNFCWWSCLKLWALHLHGWIFSEFPLFKYAYCMLKLTYSLFLNRFADFNWYVGTTWSRFFFWSNHEAG